MEQNIKKNIYKCITESLCCVAEISTTLMSIWDGEKKKSFRSPNTDFESTFGTTSLSLP